MSLLKKTRVVERAVDAGEHGEVGIRVARAGDITISWMCGDIRTFTAEDLTGIIDDVDLLSQYPDVWFVTTDRDGRNVAARVVDGKLYADTAPHESEGGRYVPWAPLRKAMRKAIGD